MRALLIGLVLMEVFLVKPAQPVATVKLTNAICISNNKTWVTFGVCRLRAVSRSRTVLNIEFDVHYPVNDGQINFQMIKRDNYNDYKRWLGNYTVDFCAFLRKANHPVIKLLYKVIKEFSTLNHTCPYNGRQFVKNLYWNPIDLPLPLPSGDYGLLLTWILQKRTQCVTKFYFTFKQDVLKD